jgi:hypothetical protein
MSSYHNIAPDILYAEQEFSTSFVPRSSAITDDWNVDGVDVIRSREMVNYMADPSRAQPLMAGELDLDAAGEP